MVRVLFFVSVLLSCLPFLHSAADGNNYVPICPESFSCPGLGALKYPFYNVTDRKCWLIKINCTSKEIQFRGWVYEFVGMFDCDNDSNHNSDYIAIYNRTFQQLVKNKSCDALTNNFTPPSPSPLLYSISIILTYPQQQEPYFDKHSYNCYNKCKDHSFYYNYFNGTIPSDLPRTCQVVQLPMNMPSSHGLIETNIFSLLSPVTAIVFNLSDSYRERQKAGRQCATSKDGRGVHCFGVKKGI
ncbi:putative LEAF RUST 10 DISEASE-RESISTANCE LOCUS RECEPTOR-LIKE PROTEIN KINASE-like 1.1/1.2/1.3/1.4 [Helianthus debilis subsp. tardiflorus]